VLQESLNLSHN